MMSEITGLKRRTAKGLLWSGLGNGIIQVLSLIFGVLLSRILTPSDYGIVGALTIFSAIAGTFTESGFILAIINKKNLNRNDLNAVFWFNIAIGLFFYIVLFFCAPLIAEFYHQPEMVLISRILFLSGIFGAFSPVPVAYMMRYLKLKEKSRLQMAATLISGIVGVVCAFVGLGYWSLVYQYVSYCLLYSFFLWMAINWRPSFSFKFKALKQLMSFGLKQLAVAVFNIINNNIFTVLLGYFYNMRITGFYTQGNKWTTMGYSTLNGMINSVGQPVMRQISNDLERTKRIFKKLLRFTSFVCFPIMFGMALVSHEVIIITVTDKWFDSIVVMQILSFGAAFIPIATLYGNLFNSMNRPSLYMWNVIILGCFQLFAVCFTYRFGLNLMLTVYVSINILWLFVWQRFANRLIGIKFIEACKEILPFCIISGIIMLFTYFTSKFINNLYLSLFYKISIALILYIICSYIVDKSLIKDTIEYFKKKKS